MHRIGVIVAIELCAALAGQQDPGRSFADLTAHVPQRAAVVGLIAAPAGDVLGRAIECLPPAVVADIDRQLERTRQFGSLRELVASLEARLEDRALLVVSADPPIADPAIPVVRPASIPRVALAIPVRAGEGPSPGHELSRLMQQYSSALGFTKVYQLSIDPARASVAWEYCHPAIPGTGELAVYASDDLMILSNSGPLLRDLVRTSSRAAGAEELDDASPPTRGSAALYVRSELLQPLIRAACEASGSDRDEPGTGASAARAALRFVEALGRARGRVDLELAALPRLVRLMCGG